MTVMAFSWQVSAQANKADQRPASPEAVKVESDLEAAADAYDAKGVEMGQFMLFPKFEVDGSYNSNIYATNSGAKDDYYTTLRPELALRSRFENHALNVISRVERKFYSNYSVNDVTDYYGSVDGRIDVTKATTLSGWVNYSDGHEDRASPDEAQGKSPTPHKSLELKGDGTARTGRFISTLQGVAQRDTFEDVQTSTGTNVANHLRDRWQYEEIARGAYEVQTGYFAVLEGAVNQRRYDEDVSLGGINRDSDGWRVNAGLGLDISQVIRGDFLVGYFEQDYKDASLKNVQGYSIRSSFNWTPTRTLLVVPSLRRSVEESTASGVSSLVRTSAAVLVRKEVQRNFIVTTGLGYTEDDYQGSDQRTNLYEWQLRPTYLFTPELSLSGEVSVKHKLSTDDQAGYNQNIYMLRLGLRL